MINLKQTRLNEEEANAVVRLRAPVIYTAIKQEGEDELARPVASLWWSGIGAGLAIFLSVLASAGLLHYAPSEGYDSVLKHLGYTVGFLVVILGRLQLFTENTITAVIPLLSYWNRKTFFAMIRIWTIVFCANMVGVFIASGATVYGGIFPAEITSHIIELSEHYIDRSIKDFFMQGIPAGFIIAALVWMLPSSRGSEFGVIIVMTFLISLSGLTHVIAGSGEVFVMLLMGKMSIAQAFLGSILPTLGGNVLGGTALFALLAYGQVKEEI